MYKNPYYSNLLKRGYTNVDKTEKRVINTNELVAKRMQELSEKMQQEENAGFVSGIEASADEVEALLADVEVEEASQSIIKVKEEAARILEDAHREAEALLERARTQAAQLEKDSRSRAELERMQMLETARTQGVQEGKEQAYRENEGARRELKEQRKQMEREFEAMIDELEPQFVDTITDIYEHIFHVELHSYREILGYLISTTMRKVEGNRDFMIHVSKEDYPYISMQKKQIAAGATAPNSSVEVVEDLSLAKNQCLIETEGGIFDCGLGTQLSELRQKLKMLSYEKKQ